MRFTAPSIVGFLALVALAAPAAAVSLGGVDYEVETPSHGLALDTRDAAGASSPVAVNAEAEVDAVRVSGRTAGCEVPEGGAAACDAGHSDVDTGGAPAVRYDVDVQLPLGYAPAARAVENPSFREMVAYGGAYELTTTQLAVAAAAAGAASGLAYAIWRALKTGGLLALLPLATHLKPSELLDDAHRKGIYELIRTEPGVSTKEIADRLGLAWGTVTHHLVKLEKARFVVSQKFGKYRRYFVNGSGIEAKEQVAVMKVARTGDVVEYVRAHPGASQKDVSVGMGVSSSTVLWHVKRLVKVGVVEKVRDGKSVRYFIRETPSVAAAASPAALAPLQG